MSDEINNLTEASSEEWLEDSANLGKIFGELALSFYGLVFPPTAVAKILYDQFSGSKRSGRVKRTLESFRNNLKILKSLHSEDRKTMEELKTRLEMPYFLEAVATACEESVRASNEKKVDEFAAVLAGSLTPNMWSNEEENVATFIRDVAQLGDRDIQILRILSAAFKDLMASRPQLDELYLFTNNNQLLESQIEKLSFHRDDFYSTCGRLIGFGLAIEEPWPMTRTQPHGRCIRPTRHGMTLLEHLERFSPAKQGSGDAKR